jgi:AcrR family transcriptional regulator
MAAAVRLVSERGTTAVAATDLTEAADVSRKLLYLHFGDRDALFVAAALDLVQRGLDPQIPQDLRERVLGLARLFAQHRPFYRAMLTGSCAFAMTAALNDLLGELSRKTVRELFDGSDQNALDEKVLDDVALFFAGGAVTFVTHWLTDERPAEELADRLLRVASILAPSYQASARGGRTR